MAAFCKSNVKHGKLHEFKNLWMSKADCTNKDIHLSNENVCIIIIIIITIVIKNTQKV